jgi:cephalosporin hydroxylase
MDPFEEFERLKREQISSLGSDKVAKDLTRQWFEHVSRKRYSYHFTWMGRPIIQFPQDIMATQEIIWETKPDLIIETGIAHGGSLIFSASMLELLGGDGIVVGIDVEIRAHNRAALDAHPMRRRIHLIEGSSIDLGVIENVNSFVKGRSRVLVLLDSNHEKQHVLSELRHYGKFVTVGSYMVVFDTIIDEMPASFSEGRPWGRGRGPKAAIDEFLKETDHFAVDETYPNKLLITVAPGGFLRCVRK